MTVFAGSKHKVQPNYEVRPAGNKTRQRFLCELRVPGFDYVAAGNSTSKKDAQTNAARDFTSFLVRQGLVQNHEVPAEAGMAQMTPAMGAGLGLTKSAPVFNEGYHPKALGAAYQRRDQEPGQGDFRRDFLEGMDKKRMEEAEDVDVNAGIHGNWTIENAKSMLHQLIQIRKINTDYKYGKQGSSFTAEMSFFVKVPHSTILFFFVEN